MYATSRIPGDPNPYLTEAHAAGYGRAAQHDAEARGRTYATRLRLASMYAWAIPDHEALSILRLYAPLIEIGAGTGYWAWMLRRLGADILAFDNCPPTTPAHANRFHNHPHARGLCWTEVQLGGPEQLPRYPERTLFLCWPPYDEPMASECLRRYSGDILIYVGEHVGGATGDPAFHDALAADWTRIGVHHIPNWDRMLDVLMVYKRTASMGKPARAGRAGRSERPLTGLRDRSSAS